MTPRFLLHSAVVAVMVFSYGCGDKNSTAVDGSQVDASIADGSTEDGTAAEDGWVVCAPVPQNNLTPNPGFEILEESWVLPETAFTSVGPVTEDVHQGQVALKVEHQGETAWEGWTADGIPVPALEEIHFSAYLKTDGLTGQVRFVLEEFDAADASTAAYATPVVSGTTPWSEQTLDFTTTDQTRNITLRIEARGASGGQFSGSFIVDDFSLSAVTPPMLVGNPSFDSDLSVWGWHQGGVPVYVFRDTAVFRSDPASVRLDPTTQAPCRETWNRNFPVAAGQVVVASVWSRTDPGSYPNKSGSLVNVDFRSTGDPQIQGTGNAMLLPWDTLEWTRTEVTDVAAPGESRVVVALGGFPQEHAGSVWFDDVSVTLVDLVPNPGFEYFRPADWDFVGIANDQFSSRLDHIVRRCGRVSLRVDFHGRSWVYGYLLPSATGSQYHGGILATAIKVDPGTTVRLEGYVRTENLTAPAGLDLSEYDAGGNGLTTPHYVPQNPTATIQGTEDWTLLSRTVTLTDLTEYVLVRIRVSVDHQIISGTAWFDDVTLIPQ